jgi:hypothetical protein
MANKLNAEMSKILNEMVKRKEIFHNFRFPAQKFWSEVLADNLVIKNDGTIYFIECKMSKRDFFNKGSAIKPKQIETNQFLRFPHLKHFYFFATYRLQKNRYSRNAYIILDISNVKTRINSVIEENDLKNQAFIMQENMALKDFEIFVQNLILGGKI